MGGFRSSAAGSGGLLRRTTSDSTFRNDRDRPDYHSNNNAPNNQPSNKPWLSQNERSNSFTSGKKNINIKKPSPNPNQQQTSGAAKSVGDPQRPSSQQSSKSSSSSNLSALTHTRDPRFNSSNSNSNINAEGAHHRQDSSESSELAASGGHNKPKPAHSVDPFGRSRDWGQKPRARKMSPGSDALRNSPSKSKPVKSFLPNPSPQTNEKTLLSASKSTMLASSTGLTSTNSSSNNASSAASDPSPESTKKNKPEPGTPLLVSSLGNAEVVKRAETVVLHLHEVVSVAKAKTDTKELPSKREIMKAVEEIEKLVKKTKSEADDAEQETEKAMEEEEARRAQEATLLVEKESQRQVDIENRKEDRRKEEEHSKILADQEAEDQSKIRYEEELKRREAQLDENVTKAKEGKKILRDKDLQAKISEASTGMDKSIAKARREMEKSKLSATKISKKLATAEKSYKAVVESEKKKKQKKKKPIKKECIPLEDIVNSITSENKRKVKEAHALSLAIADPHFGLDAYEFKTSLQQDASHEVRDPKYKKTFEEWSIMANQVTGLSTSLYSEPSESPYYEQNERNHASVGPLVKEYVRDKQKRLNKHWLMLAEEYEVRKRLYEKQQRKLAKKAQRVSVTSRKSIMGKKEKEKPVDKGPKTIESGGRSSNNPYRRARRGNEVRSEYEQEQIIAEIAAREAMEKRISHGGSKLPRQVGPLERVSIVIV